MQNKNIYTLAVGVGNYEKINISNLPTYGLDLALIGSAIVDGLKVSVENIRLIAGTDNNGYVTTSDLAKAIANFKSLLGDEDTFILYFSGHGRERNIIFSNGQLELQSVINFVDNLPAKNKIVILDCCYSGNFETKEACEMQFGDSVNDFAGHGIAIMASSSADEVSRLGPRGNHSVFTGALSTAIRVNKNIRKGRLSLEDIYAETKRLVLALNKHNPGKEQMPIFRSRIGGTIYFKVEDYSPYEQMHFEKETENYKIVSVKPLSSSQMKRLAVFVIPKVADSGRLLAEWTKEIAQFVKYAEIYENKKSEEHFEGTLARAVWCYFAKDESDIINHLHFAYTIWAADESVAKQFFKENKNARIIEGIYLYENSSYDMLKKMQEPTVSREEFIEENKNLLVTIVSMAERFIADLQEVANKLETIEEIQEKYYDWICRVRKRFLKLSELDVPPNDLHDWCEAINSLAGWVVDLSLILENKQGGGVLGEREVWLINDAVRKYHESLEELAKIEKNIRV